MKAKSLKTHIAEINKRGEVQGNFLTLVDDLDHWEKLGITTPDELDRYLLECQASDMFKDANGFRFRGIQDLTDAELHEMILNCETAITASIREEEQQKADSAKEFEDRISKTISMGAGDRETAIHWILDGEIDPEDRGTQLASADYLRYELGLPYFYEAEFKTVLAA